MPGTAGEAGQPGQPLGRGGDIFAQMLVRAGHDEAVQILAFQLFAQFYKAITGWRSSYAPIAPSHPHFHDSLTSMRYKHVWRRELAIIHRRNKDYVALRYKAGRALAAGTLR